MSANYRRLTRLTIEEHEEISLGSAHGQSLRALACTLKRSPSRVPRVITRNRGLAPGRASPAYSGVMTTRSQPVIFAFGGGLRPNRLPSG